jgi:threonine/homoserine/homoserine lactone efflux protein
VESLLAFIGLSIVVIVTPGPDTALTIRNTLFAGRRSGVWTAAGVSSGQAVWTLATASGLAAVLVASEPAFHAIRLAGAAYLIYLGVQSLRAALFGGAVGHAPGQAAAQGSAVSLRQGLVSNLGNPKMALFFTSLLPQFAPTPGPSFVALLLLGAIFCSMTFVWLAGYAVVVSRAGDQLRRPRVRRAIDVIAGVALTAFGIRLAAEPR